jgi:type II restriction enzyme
MSHKKDLRKQRVGTVINLTSKQQEKALSRALSSVCEQLYVKFPGITLRHQSEWLVSSVIENLKSVFSEVDFHHFHKHSSMRPDGGILSIVSSDGKSHPILIAEKKNQGTNDLRAREGKAKQAKGNAIERLGKNVIGFRAALLTESIFPFICFGDGCDFADDSSILDRVVTIAMFGRLNIEHLHNQGPHGVFNRGTFYFRVKEWTEPEMAMPCISIAIKSVHYYFSKYGDRLFLPYQRET